MTEMRSGYWVIYSTSKYEPDSLEYISSTGSKDARLALTEFLNGYAGNEDFHFTVIRGTEVRIRPVHVAKEYRID